ncbi:unnamed protein product, partial [Coccothraustes coccothraustes]
YHHPLSFWTVFNLPQDNNLQALLSRPEPRAPSAPLETRRTGIRVPWCTSVCG